MSKFLILIISVFSWQISQAQEIQVKGKFLEDSTVIGDLIPYSLSVRSPKELDLFLPDSTSNFSGFHFHEQVWFESRLDKGMVLDSVIYYLSTFDISPVQILSLKLYSWNGTDSVQHTSSADTIFLQQVVDHVPDSLADLKLLETTDYYRVDPPFNTAFLLIGIIIFLNIIAFTYLIFGKRIWSWWRLRSIKSRHRAFLEKYQLLFSQLDSEKESFRMTTEKLLIHWKNYAEKLEGIPYPKLTTREINEITNNQKLDESLRQIDKAIYARNNLEPVKSGFEMIKDLSMQTYNKKVEEIRHGK